MFARARHSKIPSKSEIARKIQFHFFSLFSSSCSHIHTLYMCICFPQTLLLFTFKFHFSFFPSLKCTYSHRFLIVYFEIPHNCELFFAFFLVCTFYVYIFCSFALLLVAHSSIVALFLLLFSFYLLLLFFARF